MSNKKKKILTAHVHRLNGGVLESYAPGQPAPDWVTNPDLLADAAEHTPPPAPAPTPPEPTGSTEELDAVDGLDDLKGDELKQIAEDLEIAKSGSKPELIARIRAKRAELAADAGAGADGDRDSLIEQAKALGIEVDENQSDVELQALIDDAKG